MFRTSAFLVTSVCVVLANAQCITTFPSTENFTGGTVGVPGTLVTGWSNLSADDLDWNVDNNGTNGGVMTTITGPIGDHTSNNTGGKYMYVESGSAGASPSKSAILQSNCYDISSLASPYLTFWYSMRGANMGSLTVDLNVNGSIVPNLWTVSGNQVVTWKQGWLNLAPYLGQTNLRIRFRAITGSGALSDIAIDDVVVGNLTPVFGCPDVLASNYSSAANVNNATCEYSCPVGQKRVTIDIVADNYPQESSWTLKNASTNATLASGTSVGTSVCVPENTCLLFRINDTAGDGIWHASYGYGAYSISFDGAVVFTGGQFTQYQETSFNCPPGYSCSTATVAVTGQVYTAPLVEYWYNWTPAAAGSYTITTCGLNTCDTKLWLYDMACGSINLSSGVEGATFADDDNGGCGLQARITANMPAGQLYHIRVGTNGGSCTSASFRIDYNGPAVGCMNVNSCNYDPLATVACTNCCLAVGDPACPMGPDLTMDGPALISSLNATNALQVVNIATSDICAVQEGCVKGFGNRSVIRFTTRINNIGQADYYIGSPSGQPGMFSTQNCHGHAHYSGYADYLLFDQNNNPIPVGFKNGYCVIDVGCNAGFVSHYGCSNMGISKGCYDIYGSGTTCNWIDVTDVPAGLYTMVLRTNWARRPDALGRHEMNYTNNYTSACINLTGTPGGTRAFTVATRCTPVIDCMGQAYGDAKPDCVGTCNGTTKSGDQTNNGIQDQPDAQMYVSEILGDDAVVSPCTDLNIDGEITVTDAALLANCYNQQTAHDGQTHLIHYHPWCDFPRGYVSTIDTADITIGAFNPTDKYVDIWIKNSTCRTLGYEFNMSGITIQTVENLNPQIQGDIVWSSALGGNKVIGLSYIDSSLAKNTGFVPLCRVRYLSLTGTQICIASIQDIVNKDANNITGRITGPCITVNNVVAVSAKVMLEGPFDGVSKMRDDLRVASLLPSPEPYTSMNFIQTGGGEVAGGQVFGVTGDNAVVDWVLVELRNSGSPATVLAARCALLQRDGDIVDLDGSASVIFPVSPGNYFVSVRHRNHLGVMTASAVALSGSSATVDFRSAATATWGTEARKVSGATMLLWAGNVFRDGSVSVLKYVGVSNDRDVILTAVGGTTPTSVVSGYMREDVNLSGNVKYTGAENDRDPILVNIGSVLPTNTRAEQLP
ncbi:MAG: hypothetical protein IPP33_06500 [Flavobacteriales bacterium]|nr:hypothetical protein [Flavobacteriales bacterium]